MTELAKFFDHQKPYSENYLNTGDGHKLYFACYGNPNGKPIIILHGGPGYGSEAKMVRFFDPLQWNILLFDQRGTGLSTPLGSIQCNTTAHLINDINLLADHVGFTTFTLKGGSWGVTLALAYAQRYPNRVTSLILTGVFLGDKEGSLITKIDGAQRHFPDIWDYFLKPLSTNERSKPFDAYWYYISKGSKEEQLKFAKEAIVLELTTEAMGLTRTQALVEVETFDYYSVAIIEYHYLINDYFLSPRQILDDCVFIRDIPTTIIHGRYDMICPPESAWKLAKRLNNCKLIFADPAGHSENESVTAGLMIQASKKHFEF